MMISKDVDRHDENREEITQLVEEICYWLLGIIDWGEKEITEYKTQWKELGVKKSQKEADECFKHLIQIRAKLTR